MEKLNKKMTKIINKCCGLNIKAKLNSQFWMSENKKIIAYSLIPDTCDKDFCNFVNKTWNCKFEPCTLALMELSILHEVGHFKTFPYFSDNAKFYNQLCKIIIDKIPFDKLQNYLYFNLPLEKKATEWAINFMRKYPKRAKYFADKMYIAVQEFYKNTMNKNANATG